LRQIFAKRLPRVLDPHESSCLYLPNQREFCPWLWERFNTICDGLIATSIRDCYLQGVGLKAQQKGIEIKLRAAACFVSRMHAEPLEHEIEQEAPSQGIDHVSNNTVTFA
jgi:hypothetical protein